MYINEYFEAGDFISLLAIDEFVAILYYGFYSLAICPAYCLCSCHLYITVYKQFFFVLRYTLSVV